MKQPIPLYQQQQGNNESMTHAVALTLFSWARSAAAYAAEVPGIAEHAASEIVRAWDDSAKAQQRPKQ